MLKWLELLKEIDPRMTRAAVLRDPVNPRGTAHEMTRVHRPARRRGSRMAARRAAMPAEMLAAQVRQQGHRCDEPLSATRDTAKL
jgi:hypothetical protein